VRLCAPRHGPSAEALLEERKSMVTVRVKGGTPASKETLCRTCSRGHIIKGYSAMEEAVFCRIFYIEREIPFVVSECTFYEDKRLASKEDMEQIAWFLTTRKPGRSVGFVSAARFHELKLEGEESSPINKEADDTTE
jgi:hypothetical protein